jgi:hypothetical protein
VDPNTTTQRIERKKKKEKRKKPSMPMTVFPSFGFQQWTLVARVEWELAPTRQGRGRLNQHFNFLYIHMAMWLILQINK